MAMAQFRAMTWNVENLFEVGTEAGPATEEELAAKIESLRAVIDAQRPDVLALQEVGSEGALARLQQALHDPMPHRRLGTPDGRGIRVAFLGRLELHDPVDIGPFPRGLLPIQVGDDPPGPAGPELLAEMGRGALRVTVRAGGRDVHVIATHLKSKLLTFPRGFQPANEDQRARYAAYALYRRASEATTLRTHLDALLDGGGRTTAVVLAGDLNDEVEAATTQILNGPPGSEIGTAGFAQPDRGDGDRMWNLAPLIPAERRYSRVYRGRRELIDHVFVSHYLARGRTTAVTTVMAEGALPSIADDPTARRGEPGSDHAAVVATFDL
jgi:endonuclease/exonuclease/phosphatase family metal-dependent hydrolase